jgi:hypothetical protein
MKTYLESFKGLHVTWINAVHGKKNPYVRLSYKQRGITNNFEHSDGVLGCLASHRWIWERELLQCTSADPYWILIMEDDVQFHPLYSDELLSSYLKEIPADAMLLKFGYLGTHEFSCKYVPVNEFWTSTHQAFAFSTICYAVRSDLLLPLLNHRWVNPVDVIIIPGSYGMINPETILGVPVYTAFRTLMNKNTGSTELYHGLVSDKGFESTICV